MIIKDWENIPEDCRPKIRYWLPGAAVDEEDLEKELELLKERGFGGVEAVSYLRLQNRSIMHSEDGWGTRHWDHAVSVIARKTARLGMSFDLANGPGWPISMPGISDADAPGTLRELTYGVTEVPRGGSFQGKLSERRVKHPEGTPEMIAVMAYRKRDGKLVKESYRDLSDFLEEKTGELTCFLPEEEEGESWLIFAFYSQPAVHMTMDGSFYVIDHLSREGVERCRDYWDPILRKNSWENMESIFCDSLEYRVSLEWTDHFPEEFEKRRGYSILPWLPFLGIRGLYPEDDIPGYRLEQPEISDMINHDYLETLTQCYCEYHLAGLERMAERYGKNIRYQVAYNKPFEIERCPLWVGIPENEALGRPAMDGLKTMAAAAHLGRKKKFSFECAAEFGNCYGQDYEDLFWWVKRSLMSGINAQVVHGAAYSGKYTGKLAEDGFLEHVQWPGYETFQTMVSNFWNRTLSAEDAKGCMDTIARMNAVFRRKAKVDCAVFRCEYRNNGEGSEHFLFDDGGKLCNSGYSYETVSEELLNLPVCSVTHGILDEDGVGYQCLIVPEQKAMTASAMRRIRQLSEGGLAVIRIGELPGHPFFYSEQRTEEEKNLWKEERKYYAMAKGILSVRSAEDAEPALKMLGVRPRFEIEVTDRSGNLVTAVHEDPEENRTYFAVYGYNCAIFSPDDPNPKEMGVSAMFREGSIKGTYRRPGEASARNIGVSLKGTGKMYFCDPWTGKTRPLNFRKEADRMCGELQIEEDEMLILCECRNELPPEENVREPASVKIDPVFTLLELEEFGPDSEGEKSFLRSGYSGKISLQLRPGEPLLPWRELLPKKENFAGRGCYSGSFTIGRKRDNVRYLFHPDHVCDTFSVRINGIRTEFPDQVKKQVDITELVHTGENSIKVTVVSNLYNRILSGPPRPFMKPEPKYFPKDYGMWEKKAYRTDRR